MLEVKLQENRYILVVPEYNSELVEFCRSLQSARYVAAANCWVAPRTVPNAIDLNAAGHFFDKELLANVRKLNGIVEEPTTGYDWELNPQIYKPMQHQLDWEQWCRDKPRCICVADIGLGKTIMTFLWWRVLKLSPADIVVVCPASLVDTWKEKIKEFTGVDALAIIGSPANKTRNATAKGLHIVNYESFEKFSKYFKGKLCLVCDESHKLKNPNADRSKDLYNFSLRDHLKYLLQLTGTPIAHGAQDYYSPFKLIAPTLLGSSFTAFKKRYCIEEQIRGAPIGIRKVVGYKKLEELTQLISPYYRGYLQKDCIDLPEKTYSVRYVDLSPEQTKAYKALHYDMVTELKNGESLVVSNILTKMLRFSQITQGYLPLDEEGNYQDFSSNPKLVALKEIIQDIPVSQSFIIMCRFVQDINLVQKALQELKVSCEVIDGRIPIPERAAKVARVQNGEVRALIGQIQTTGVGYTLTRATTMIFYSNSYSYLDRIQAEGRIHRIGTTGTCLYIDIIAKNTIDEQILSALRNKKDVALELESLRTYFKDY